MFLLALEELSGLWGSSSSSSSLPQGKKELLQFSAAHQLLPCSPPTYMTVLHILYFLSWTVLSLWHSNAAISMSELSNCNAYGLLQFNKEKIGVFISSVTSLTAVTAWIISRIISTFCILSASKIWYKIYIILRKQQLILIPLIAIFHIDGGAPKHVICKVLRN